MYQDYFGLKTVMEMCAAWLKLEQKAKNMECQRACKYMDCHIREVAKQYKELKSLIESKGAKR